MTQNKVKGWAKELKRLLNLGAPNDKVISLVNSILKEREVEIVVAIGADIIEKEKKTGLEYNIVDLEVFAEDHKIDLQSNTEGK